MILSISLAWPTKEKRDKAAQRFRAAVVQFEEAVRAANSASELDADATGTGVGAGLDGGAEHGAAARSTGPNVAWLWKEMVQNGAPHEVRANAWLTLAWVRRCIHREEPRLFWAAVVAGVFVGSAWIYDLARALAELLTT